MQARGTSAPRPFATRIKGTTVFSVNDVVEQAIKFCFEHCLQAPEDETSACCSENEEAEVQRNQVFGQRITVHSGADCSAADESMTVRMDQS